MKKIIIGSVISLLMLAILPIRSLAAGGIFASGGGDVTVGQTVTVNIVASGASFDTVHGSISISGPVAITSFVTGDATWISKPSNDGTFDGAFLGEKKTSFTVATIKLKGTSAGSGAVSVNGAYLKNAGAVVGSNNSSASFSFEKAPDLPGKVLVSSSTHPDQNTPYEATTISLSWNKDSGVDGFSYLLDQVAGTTPSAKITDAGTSATFTDKAVGVYYFHIRAHKADGWGGTTHFTINIKEPDPKIDEKLEKPSGIKIERVDNAVNNITDGTLTGITIFGKTEPNFTANIALDPAPTLPEGKTLSTTADTDGKFSLLIDFPLKAGYYKLSVQGQKEKVLTPIYNNKRFEISLKDGGTINIITEKDIATKKQTNASQVKGAFINKEFTVMQYLIVTLTLAVLVLIIIELLRFIKKRRSKKNKI